MSPAIDAAELDRDPPVGDRSLRRFGQQEGFECDRPQLVVRTGRAAQQAMLI
jgi:hypothetical protein